MDEPHSLKRGSSIHYYATDYPGDVVGLIGSQHELANEYYYFPFGAREYARENVPNALRFQARYHEASTGLYHFRSRWYDPSLQRFNSEDPIGLEGGINPYAFAENNPVNFTDPWGLAACPAGQIRVVQSDGSSDCWSISGGGGSGGRTSGWSTPRFCRGPCTTPSGPGTGAPAGPREGGSGGSPGRPGTPAGNTNDPARAPAPTGVCGNAAPMASSQNYPYPASYFYRGVNANYMFEHGGSGAWGNSVRGCLVCMYQQEAAPAPAHNYCYASADARVSAWESGKGYTRAVGAATFYYYRGGRLLSNPLVRF